MIKKWSFLRTKNIVEIYQAALRDRSNVSDHNDFFTKDNTIIKSFQYWVVVENKFPYDAIADIHHLLIPKRKEIDGWLDLNSEEGQELLFIRNSFIQDNYDMVSENMPRSKTITNHFHIHLMVLKRREVL